MSRVLGWGLLGTGRINRSLIPAIRNSSRCRLVAVSSRNPETARIYSREWQIPKSYGSYADMLADPEVEVVYNSLPNSLHAEWTLKAIEAGKHILCEKPLAITLAEVDAILAASRRMGVVVTEAFMYRHHPQTIKIQELIKAGLVGKIWLVRSAFSFQLTRKGDIRLDPGLGGGSLWDVGCYPVSITRALLESEPVEVNGWQVLGSTGIDLSFVGQMRFPGEVAAQIDSSFSAPSRQFLEIVGDAGSLTIEQPFTPRGEGEAIFKQDNREDVLTMPEGDAYLGEVEDLAGAVLQGDTPRISLADSRRNTAALLALYESARLGRPVALSD
ncbi:MAG: Gfo/Idh/MocA family oxidoreductase [Chloroflexi bacterium]|nr:Gfo/Idh/MocA family oxidoreductase [Chloroflexota bacterium]